MYRVFSLYAFSGFISLAYQVTWFRIFMDWFGSTSLTFGLVVANFIGGLGIGAYFSHSIVRWIKGSTGFDDNLRVYGLVEALVGLAALVTVVVGFLPLGFAGSFPYELNSGVWELALSVKTAQLFVAMACVLVPCIFMGVTFPLLCHSFLQSARFPSSLYAWNTLGACTGILVSQFILLPMAGHGMTFALAALANILLGGYFLVSGGAPAIAVPKEDADAKRDAKPPGTAISYSFLLMCGALSGFLAGALEGDLFKRISFLLQVSPGALMTFISFWAILAIFLASLAVRQFKRIRFPVIQIAFVAAFLFYGAVAQPVIFDTLTDWIRNILLPVSVPESLPYEFASALTFPSNLTQLLVLTGCVVFVPFFLLSLLLPYICNRGQSDGRHLGLIYGLNTLAFCAGLILFTLLAPAVNIFFSTKYFLLLFLLVVILFCFFRESRPPGYWRPAVLVLALVLAWVVVPKDFDRGYFRANTPSANGKVVAVMADANTTTHVVEFSERSKILFFDRLFMTGTLPVAQAYMRLMAHFPLLSQTEPKRALLIAFGVGNTASAIAAHASIEQLDVVDLNRNVFATAPQFRFWNRDVLQDPRVRLIHDDGRHFLRSTDGSYDLITSEPPPPMAAGVYRLYSREYYEAALDHLTPSGMMSQWLPIYQMPPEAIDLAIRTFIEVFPESAMFTGWNNNFILVGSRQPLDLAMVERRMLSNKKAAADLNRAGVADPVSLIGRLVSSGAELHEKYPAGRVISDQNNDLEHLFIAPVDKPGLDYDPRRVLVDFEIDKLGSGDELGDVLTHFGRLLYRVPGFPMESLARVPADAGQSLVGRDADWLRIRNLEDSALVALGEGALERAAKLLRSSLAINPEQPKTLVRLAKLEIGRGRNHEAARLLQNAVRIVPRSAEPYFLLGQASLSFDVRTALESLSRATELAPRWVMPLNARAWILATHADPAIRRPKEAVDLAERAVGLSSREDALLLDTLAAAYASAGDFSRAQAIMKEAIGKMDQAYEREQEAGFRERLALYEDQRPMIEPDH